MEEILAIHQTEEDPSHHRHLQKEVVGQVVVEAQEVGNGKLMGNPPTEFNGDRSKADAFMSEFDLYVLANIDTDTMASPMKRRPYSSVTSKEN